MLRYLWYVEFTITTIKHNKRVSYLKGLPTPGKVRGQYISMGNDDKRQKDS